MSVKHVSGDQSSGLKPGIPAPSFNVTGHYSHYLGISCYEPKYPKLYWLEVAVAYLQQVCRNQAFGWSLQVLYRWVCVKWKVGQRLCLRLRPAGMAAWLDLCFYVVFQSGFPKVELLYMDTCWASDCETPVDITLAKANHMTKSRLSVGEACSSVCARRSGSLGIVTKVTIYLQFIIVTFLPGYQKAQHDRAYVSTQKPSFNGKIYLCYAIIKIIQCFAMTDLKLIKSNKWLDKWIKLPVESLQCHLWE